MSKEEGNNLKTEVEKLKNEISKLKKNNSEIKKDVKDLKDNVRILKDISMHVNAEETIQMIASRINASPRKAEIILLLLSKGELTQKAIGEKLNIDRTNLPKYILDLIKSNLIIDTKKKENQSKILKISEDWDRNFLKRAIELTLGNKKGKEMWDRFFK